MEGQKRWQINVQKDGQRRSFYSSASGRTGQREANAKADAWLECDIEVGRARVSQLLDEYLESLKITTSRGSWMQVESICNVWIKPNIGPKKIEKLTEQHLQDIVNKAYGAGKS